MLISSMITTVLPTPAPPYARSCRLEERADQVDDLDAGREQFGRRRLIDEGGGGR
jgi:hypothetical protein